VTPPNSPSSNAVILERIEGIRCDVGELKGILSAHMADERRAREEYLVEHAATVGKVDAAHRRLDVLEPMVTEMRTTISRLEKATLENTAAQKLTNKILAFIASAIGIWLINLFLGLIK